MATRNLVVALLLAVQRATPNTVPCYDLNGDLADPTNAVPCNPSAEGTKGSHSACCSTVNKDACLSTGLCLASWGVGIGEILWVTWCTDSTWQDPACARFCVNNSERAGNLSESVDSTSASPSASETVSQAPVCSAGSDSASTAAIVGGVLGAVLAASLVLLVVLALSNRRLRRRLKASKDTPGAGKLVPQPPETMAGAPIPAMPPCSYEIVTQRAELSGSARPTEIYGN
ncbi:hypothetical protein ACJZ2D_015742 [Fusarium nematophilum]